MENILSKNSRIVTARPSVPPNTLPGSPVSLKITSQLPILESLKVYCFSAAGAVTPIETGWKLSSAGTEIIPSMGSSDSLAPDIYAPTIDSYMFDSGEINAQLPGPPYEMDFKFYNSDAAAVAYYFIIARLTAKILLPVAPITTDEKEK